MVVDHEDVKYYVLTDHEIVATLHPEEEA